MNKEPRIDATDEARVETSIAKSCLAASGAMSRKAQVVEWKLTIECREAAQETQNAGVVVKMFW